MTDRDLFRPLVAAYLRMSFRGRASQAFAGQLAFYALATAGLAAERLGRRLGPLALPYFFCTVSVAGLGGLARFARGGAEAVWAPTGQTVSERAA